MTKELNDKGIACGRHRVARLMRENGIVTRRRKAFGPAQPKLSCTYRSESLAKLPHPKAGTSSRILLT